MAKANFTYALKRFFPGIAETAVKPGTVKEVLAQLEQSYSGLSGYIVDDQGQLRQHVNVFINGNLIKDRKSLSDMVEEGDEVYFMQALSGG
jgi:molybdopterin converting factor small subunit